MAATSAAKAEGSRAAHSAGKWIEEPQRSRPVVKHRLLEPRLTVETWRHPIAARRHRARNPRITRFVRPHQSDRAQMAEEAHQHDQSSARIGNEIGALPGHRVFAHRMFIALRSRKPAESNIRANTLSSHIAGIGSPSLLHNDARCESGSNTRRHGRDSKRLACFRAAQLAKWATRLPHSHIKCARPSGARQCLIFNSHFPMMSEAERERNHSRNGPPDRVDGG